MTTQLSLIIIIFSNKSKSKIKYLQYDAIQIKLKTAKTELLLKNTYSGCKTTKKKKQENNYLEVVVISNGEGRRCDKRDPRLQSSF